MQNLYEGQLVRLRAAEPGDAEILFQHQRDSEIARRDSRIGWPKSLGALRQQLENASESQSRDNASLAIETLDGQLVGGLDIQSSDSRNGTFSIGIGLSDRAAWGKGYAKEAMLLALRVMFHERRYQKCNIGVYAFNDRAVGLYRHLGFEDEGRIRRNYFSNGSYHDEILLGMTCEEFDECYPAWRIALDPMLSQPLE
jgi:RimJ/RimL family protein N-acetyltransferase